MRACMHACTIRSLPRPRFLPCPRLVWLLAPSPLPGLGCLLLFGVGELRLLAPEHALLGALDDLGEGRHGLVLELLLHDLGVEPHVRVGVQLHPLALGVALRLLLGLELVQALDGVRAALRQARPRLGRRALLPQLRQARERRDLLGVPEIEQLLALLLFARLCLRLLRHDEAAVLREAEPAPAEGLHLVLRAGRASLLGALPLQLRRPHREDGVGRVRRHEIQRHVPVLMDPSGRLHGVALPLAMRPAALATSLVVAAAALRLPGVQQCLHRVVGHDCRHGWLFDGTLSGSVPGVRAGPASLAAGAFHCFAVLVARVAVLVLVEGLPALLGRVVLAPHLGVLVPALFLFPLCLGLPHGLGSLLARDLPLHVGEQGGVRLGKRLRQQLCRQDLRQSLDDGADQHLCGSQVSALEELEDLWQDLRDLLLRNHVSDHLGKLHRRPPDLRIVVFQEHKDHAHQAVAQILG
mmetsp:Transcript_42004/g.130832  ORF Transcript_42004/g.130832 Transcript_42004/m.130832 type:complete len:467 (-) Transcript_42004:2650-4050(-)